MGPGRVVLFLASMFPFARPGAAAGECCSWRSSAEREQRGVSGGRVGSGERCAVRAGLRCAVGGAGSRTRPLSPFLGCPLPSSPAPATEGPSCLPYGPFLQAAFTQCCPYASHSQLSLTLTFWCCLFSGGLPSIPLPSRPPKGSPGANGSWALGRAQGSANAPSSLVQVPALDSASRWPLPHSFILSLTLLRTPPSSPQVLNHPSRVPPPLSTLGPCTLPLLAQLPWALSKFSSFPSPTLPSYPHPTSSSPTVTPAPWSCRPPVLALPISPPQHRPNTGCWANCSLTFILFFWFLDPSGLSLPTPHT